jgi:dTDP-4-dehydrorhamnose reductase
VTSGNDLVLIIGRNGQVSQSVEERLTTVGRRVLRIGRPEVDLTDLRSIRDAVRAVRPDVVVNAAAYTAVDRAEDDAETAYAVNAEGARGTAEAAAEVGAPIIHFSTDYVFDGTKRTPYVETDATAPIGLYGQSKLAGERLVATANPRHVILRTAWVFSPFGTNFAKTMLRLTQERPEISVVDDQRGAPTYAPDLAMVVCRIIDRLKDPVLTRDHFGVIHAVNAGETTWYAFARAIIEGAALRGASHAALRPIGTEDFPTRARRPAYSVLSADKLSRVYGICLRPWSEALSDCLDRLLGPLSIEAQQLSSWEFGKSA